MKKFKKIVLATHNQGKVSEFREMFDGYEVEIISAAEFDLPEPEETGETFQENAALKAILAMKATGLPALADDSGMCVNALDGQPGIYSARWGGEKKDFNAAMKRVNDELGDNKDRSAFFFCSLALAWPDGEVDVFDGHIDGELVWPPRGENGFGYDPMFVPENDTRTFGEMKQLEKNKMNHRAHAFANLMDYFSA